MRLHIPSPHLTGEHHDFIRPQRSRFHRHLRAMALPVTPRPSHRWSPGRDVTAQLQLPVAYMPAATTRVPGRVKKTFSHSPPIHPFLFPARWTVRPPSSLRGASAFQIQPAKPQPSAATSKHSTTSPPTYPGRILGLSPPKAPRHTGPSSQYVSLFLPPCPRYLR